MTTLAHRLARPADMPSVCVVMARAFQDDPVYVYTLPDPDRRARALPGLMRAMFTRLHAGMGHVEVAETDGHVVGAAVWDHPGFVAPGLRRQVSSLPGLLRATGRDGVKLGALGDALERARPAEPHHYLFHLGTDPGWWGRGVGASLLRPALAEADAGGRLAYLECKPDNIGYYERFGFTVAGRIDVEPVELYGMIRPAP